MATPGKGWFERHPKKTLALFFLVFLLALSAAAEKLLALKSAAHNSGIKRYIRLRDYEPSFSRYLVPSDEEMAMADSLERRPYLFRADDQGFLLPSKVHEKPDLTVVFLGGSTTACAYMDEDCRFPYLAGRLLQKKTNLKVNSYNSGVGGNNSLHSLDILLNKVIPMNPQVCVMMHNINDLTILLYEKTYWDRNPSRSPIVEVRPVVINFPELVNRTIPNLANEINNLSRKVRQWKKAAWQKNSPDPKEDEFRHLRAQTLAFDKGALVREFRKNLQTFVNLCRARDIVPVLMTQPDRLKARPDPRIAASLERVGKMGVSYGQYKELFDLFNETIREVGARSGVLVVDLARQIPQEKEYMYDVVHLTAAGSRAAAARIAEALGPLAAPLAGQAGKLN